MRPLAVAAATPSDVSGYTVEKKPTKGRQGWTKANAYPVTDTEFHVAGLTEGSEWEFRVRAVNEAGPGEPSKTTAPHTVRDPICKFHAVYTLLLKYTSFK